MGVGNTFCQLGSILEEWDHHGGTARATTIRHEAGVGDDGSLTAEVTLSVPFDRIGTDAGSAVECSSGRSEDDSIVLAIDTGLAVPTANGYDVDVRPGEATVSSDGEVLLTVTLGLEPATVDEGSAERTRTDEDGDAESDGLGEDGDAESAGLDEDGAADPTRTDGATDRSERPSVPLYEDRDRLEELYETYDTFAEMADALEMDVSGETIRRYTIDHDIHQPTSYRTSPDPESTTETEPAETEPAGTEPAGTDDGQAVVVSDGIGFPDGITAEDVIETVNRSNTLYEVKTDLDLEYTEAQTMLQELNLLTLVEGRLANDERRETTRADVIERLREVSKPPT